jgi:hypothetical protein
MVVPVFLSQMSCDHNNETSFDWYSADPSAIDTNIVADGSASAKCANAVSRTGFIYKLQVFQNIQLRNAVTAANDKAPDLTGAQKLVGGFVADTAEHFTHLLDIDHIRIFREQQLVGCL